MASVGNVFNVTPHAIDIFDKDGKTLLAKIPSNGELRLKSTEQRSLEPMQAEGCTIPLITPQVFVGLDTSGAGYASWAAHPTGLFVVSQPMAAYLTTEGRQELGSRLLYTPATGPGYGVRDAGGKILGCKALEKYY